MYTAETTTKTRLYNFNGSLFSVITSKQITNTEREIENKKKSSYAYQRIVYALHTSSGTKKGEEKNMITNTK